VAPLIRAGAVALFVDINGILAWGGPIWTKKYTRSTQTLEVGGAEFWAYFASRVQAADYTNTWLTTKADPQAIAKQVVADALAVTGSPPFTVVNSAASDSAFWTTVSYPLAQLQTVDSIISVLAGQGYQSGGFDYTVQVGYSSNLPAAQVTFSYPRAGRTYGVGGWSAAVDISSDTVKDFIYDEDATGQGTKVYESAMGGQLYQATAGGVIADWPLLEQVKSHTGMLLPSNNLLTQQAQSDQAISAYPLVTPTVISQAQILGPGIVNAGDDVRLLLPPGDPGFPAGFVKVFRIERMDTAVPDNGGLVLSTITFNVVPSLSPSEPPL
jgi:hypothetical protein